MPVTLSGGDKPGDPLRAPLQPTATRSARRGAELLAPEGAATQGTGLHATAAAFTVSHLELWLLKIHLSGGPCPLSDSQHPLQAAPLTPC